VVSVTTITRNCVHRSSVLHQTGSVVAGSDHLQLIKFWRSCIPAKGVCGGGGGIWLCLTTAIADSVRLWEDCGGGAQCLRLSERFLGSTPER